MKRLFNIVLASAAVLMLFAGCSKKEGGNRENILKIYNWADYIDEDVLAEFPAWYKEQTGEDVKIIYQLFDINEIMLAKIERGHEDFDVVCPSDYIIERMLRNDLLLPIDRDFGSTPNYIDGNLSPYIVDCFNKIDGNGKNANDYSVGYMWGTTGIMYNTKHVTREEASTWDVLRNPKFAGKIFIKDAFRDVYGPILIYLKQKELAEGKITLDELMYDSSDESIALVENYLKEAKKYIAGWEADFGKEMMTKEKADINLTWSGDAVWAIEEAAGVGVSLDYVVPKEGSNVWFDGWVIPKYAKNPKAAKYFINYLCRPDIAVRNMDAIGYVSAIGTPEVLAERTDEQYEPINVSYFFGEGADSVRITPVQYPSAEVIARCAMMHDSGDRTEQLLEMWSRVKGDNMNTWVILVCAAALIGLIALAFTRKRGNKRKKSKRNRK